MDSSTEMPKLFDFVLGPTTHCQNNLEEWGDRRGRFPDVEAALHGLLLGHTFPAILVGRREGRFIPGISLDGVPDFAVIQVWSSERTNVQRFAEAYRLQMDTDKPRSHHEGHIPHDGKGIDVGLVREIHVGMVARYQTPRIAGHLGNGDGDVTTFSPAGRMALSFTANARNNLQIRLFQSQIAHIAGRHSVGEQRDELRAQMGRIHEGVRLMNSYCNGTNSIQQLRRGDRAPSDVPYKLFQSRVYLGDELGLIANLVDMDHNDLGAVEDWLFRGDHWKRLLPHEKCILVSRVRRETKAYRTPFEAAYHNAFNMESLVWIRDGDCVWRFATDVEFEERVFPVSDDAPMLVLRIQEAIWKRSYHPREPHPMFDRESDAEEEPAEQENPVPITWKDQVTYPTLEEYLASADYTEELNIAINRKANEAIRKNSRASMPFALLLQGLIDFKGILNIPPGTDLFDPLQQARFLQLVPDFSGALVDKKFARQFDALTRLDALKPGDKIIGWTYPVTIEGRYTREAKWSIGGDHKGPFIFTVHHMEPATGSEYHERAKLFVHHWTLTKRWVGKTSPFTKVPGVAPVPTEFLPLDLPVSLALNLLDDRNWKREHRWAVPILAQWESLRKQFSKSTDSAPLKLNAKSAKEL